MARVTHVVTIDEITRQLGENLELIELVSANSDNIDYGETIRVDNGTESMHIEKQWPAQAFTVQNGADQPDIIVVKGRVPTSSPG